jgi:hypothetical protein
MRTALCLSAAALLLLRGQAEATEWRALDASTIPMLQDDDLERNRGNGAFLDGIDLSDVRFSENGFDWHLIRYSIRDKLDGPLWVVLHDDENAAFASMIAALRQYGGVGIAVNSGARGSRSQPGRGRCGVRDGWTAACDPNRNFDPSSPLYTNMILKQLRPNQPVIALHSNSPGFAGDGRGGRGEITMFDADAYAAGLVRIRENGFLAHRNVVGLADPDVYAIMPYRAGTPISNGDAQCRASLNAAGVNVWHERVEWSDGSLSNYLSLNRPEIAYANFEVKRERDIAIGADAQKLMIDAYLASCSALWNKPVSGPAIAR